MEKKDTFHKVFGVIIFLCGFMLIILLYFIEIPEANKPIVFGAVGTMLGIVGTVITYEYGSSRGSKDKTEAIKSMQQIPDKQTSITQSDKADKID